MVSAAQALEQELLRLEALSKAVRKIRLSSEKNIQRAAKELSEVLSLQDALAAALQKLAAAMAEMPPRQEAALVPLAAFATEIQQRMQRLQEHMHTFAELGSAAGEVTALLQTAPSAHSNNGAAPAHNGASANNGVPAADLLGEVDAKLTNIAEGARALFEAARSDDFPDVAREADTLKQRVTALRRRLETKP